jgi:hypothetical protein
MLKDSFVYWILPPRQKHIYETREWATLYIHTARLAGIFEATLCCVYGICSIISTEMVIMSDIPISEDTSAVGQWGPIVGAVSAFGKVALKGGWSQNFGRGPERKPQRGQNLGRQVKLQNILYTETIAYPKPHADVPYFDRDQFGIEHIAWAGSEDV